MSLSTDIPRQPRVTRPTAKLVDINNGEKAPLTFQRAAVAAAAAVTARVETHHVAPPSESLPPSSPSTLTRQVSFNTDDGDDLSQESALPIRAIPGGSKRQIVLSSDDESSIEGSKQKKKQKSKGK